MTKHPMDFEIDGKDTVWTCPICGRHIVENADGVTIAVKGDWSADHTTMIDPPFGMTLSVSGDVDKDRLAVFGDFLDGDE